MAQQQQQQQQQRQQQPQPQKSSLRGTAASPTATDLEVRGKASFVVADRKLLHCCCYYFEPCRRLLHVDLVWKLCP